MWRLLLVLCGVAWGDYACYRHVCLRDCEGPALRCIVRQYCAQSAECAEPCATVCRDYTRQAVDYSIEVLLNGAVADKDGATTKDGVGLVDLLRLEGASAAQLAQYQALL